MGISSTRSYDVELMALLSSFRKYDHRFGGVGISLGTSALILTSPSGKSLGSRDVTMSSTYSVKSTDGLAGYPMYHVEMLVAFAVSVAVSAGCATSSTYHSAVRGFWLFADRRRSKLTQVPATALTVPSWASVGGTTLPNPIDHFRVLALQYTQNVW